MDGRTDRQTDGAIKTSDGIKTMYRREFPFSIPLWLKTYRDGEPESKSDLSFFLKMCFSYCLPVILLNLPNVHLNTKHEG